MIEARIYEASAWSEGGPGSQITSIATAPKGWLVLSGGYHLVGTALTINCKWGEIEEETDKDHAESWQVTILGGSPDKELSSLIKLKAWALCVEGTVTVHREQGNPARKRKGE
jgi:hypothetical protein